MAIAKRSSFENPVLWMLLVLLILGGIYVVHSLRAATAIGFEPETGSLTSPASSVASAAASGGLAVKFGPGAGSPSGEAMPVGNLPGWTQTFTDDFNGTTLDKSKGWGVYVADPIPSMPGGLWTADRVAVGGGVLTLSANDRGDGRWSSGGVANTGGAKRTYGKWVMRMRMDKSNGVKYAGLMWPSSGIWPADGEIDFVEDGGGQRTGTAPPRITPMPMATTRRSNARRWST